MISFTNFDNLETPFADSSETANAADEDFTALLGAFLPAPPAVVAPNVSPENSAETISPAPTFETNSEVALQKILPPPNVVQTLNLGTNSTGEKRFEEVESRGFQQHALETSAPDENLNPPDIEIKRKIFETETDAFSVDKTSFETTDFKPEIIIDTKPNVEKISAENSISTENFALPFKTANTDFQLPEQTENLLTKNQKLQPILNEAGEIEFQILNFGLKIKQTVNPQIVLPEPKTEVSLPDSKPEISSETSLKSASTEIPSTAAFDSEKKESALSAAGKIEINETRSIEKNSAPSIETKAETVFEIEKFTAPIEKSTKKLPSLLREIADFLNVETAKIKTPEQQINSPDTPPTRAENIDLTEQILPRFFDLARLAEKSGEKKILKFRLRPAELGSIEIRLEKDSAGKLTAHFQTETGAAHEALSANLENLRDSLQNSGWQIERLEVSVNSFASGGNENRENSSRQFETVENNSVFDAQPEEKDESEEVRARLVSLRA